MEEALEYFVFNIKVETLQQLKGQSIERDCLDENTSKYCLKFKNLSI